MLYWSIVYYTHYLRPKSVTFLTSIRFISICKRETPYFLTASLLPPLCTCNPIIFLSLTKERERERPRDTYLSLIIPSDNNFINLLHSWTDFTKHSQSSWVTFFSLPCGRAKSYRFKCQLTIIYWTLYATCNHFPRSFFYNFVTYVCFFSASEGFDQVFFLTLNTYQIYLIDWISHLSANYIHFLSWKTEKLLARYISVIVWPLIMQHSLDIPRQLYIRHLYTFSRIIHSQF